MRLITIHFLLHAIIWLLFIAPRVTMQLTFPSLGECSSTDHMISVCVCREPNTHATVSSSISFFAVTGSTK